MADCWTGLTKKTINFLIYNRLGTLFHKSVDASSVVKDADYLFSLFDQVTEEVGDENVVHFFMDNEASYKLRGSF